VEPLEPENRAPVRPKPCQKLLLYINEEHSPSSMNKCYKIFSQVVLTYLVMLKQGFRPQMIIGNWAFPANFFRFVKLISKNFDKVFELRNYILQQVTLTISSKRILPMYVIFPIISKHISCEKYCCSFYLNSIWQIKIRFVYVMFSFLSLRQQ